MQFSEKSDQIIPAFVKAQGQFLTPKKTKYNPFHKSKYADLNDCFDAINPGLRSQELAIFQEATVEYTQQTNPAFNPGWKPVTDAELKMKKQPPSSIFVGYMKIFTTMFHSSGQWMKTEAFEMIMRDPGAQAIGMLETYGKRYTLTAFCGIASEDNDGNESGQDQQSIPVVSEAEKKALKRDRGKLNQGLLKCETIENFNLLVDTFVNKSGYAMGDKTFHNDFETFDTLVSEHRDRIIKEAGFKNQKVQSFFDTFVQTCEDEKGFDDLKEFYLNNEVVQNEENDKILNKLGEGLNIEGY